MDPATPDWRAFGQPVTAAPAAPAAPETRPTPAQLITRLPRSTLIAIALAAGVVVLGLALALTTPAGGDIVLEGDDEGQLGVLAAGAALTGVGGSVVAPLAELVVDVAGAVTRPGLVRLPGGSRVGDAVVAAGGYAPSADLAAAGATLNLAAPLTDGAKVLVPTLGDGAATAGGGTAGAGDGGGGGGLLDLNAATQAQLEELPGIGPVTAGRILEARGQAPFASVDELRSRGLVGDSTFGKLRELVSVGS